MKLNAEIADKLAELIKALKENDLFVEGQIETDMEETADLVDLMEETLPEVKAKKDKGDAEKRPYVKGQDFNYTRPMVRWCVEYADGAEMTEAMYAEYAEKYAKDIKAVNDIIYIGRQLKGARGCAVTCAMLAASEAGVSAGILKNWYRDLCADEYTYAAKYVTVYSGSARMMREAILDSKSRTKKELMAMAMTSIKAYAGRRQIKNLKWAGGYMIRGVKKEKPLMEVGA